MNRSFISVIAGGFGTDGSASTEEGEMGEYRETTAEEVADMLKTPSVIITQVTDWRLLKHNILYMILLKITPTWCESAFWYSPSSWAFTGPYECVVSGSKVPYDVVLEMDEINDDFSDTDTV